MELLVARTASCLRVGGLGDGCGGGVDPPGPYRASPSAIPRGSPPARAL